MRKSVLFAAAAALAAAALLAGCVVLDDKPRAPAPAPALAQAPQEVAPQASAREVLRLSLWRLLAGYDAALSAVATCSQAGVIPPNALAQIQRLNAEARAGAELLRFSVSLAALAPSDGAAALQAFEPPTFAAPLPAAPLPSSLFAEPALPPGASGARLAGAVSRLNSALAAGPCATTLLAGRQAVAAQFDLWRDQGVYVPTAEFDSAIARIDASTLALAGLAVPQ